MTEKIISKILKTANRNMTEFDTGVSRSNKQEETSDMPSNRQDGEDLVDESIRDTMPVKYGVNIIEPKEDIFYIQESSSF